MIRIGSSLVLALSLVLSGCWFGRKKQQTPAVPPASAPITSTRPKTKPMEPPPDTAPAKPVQSLPDLPPIKSGDSPAETPPPKPAAKPVVRKPAKKAPPVPVAANAPTAPAPAAPAPAAGTSPVPQLGVLLTPEQRSQYEAEYARDMASAMDGLVHVLESALPPAKRESMTRIRSFMRQAEDAHGRDLATAAQLARRAAVLAQDLVQSQH